MFKAGIHIYRSLVMMICALWLFSCVPQPVLNKLPDLELTAETVNDGCILNATFSGELMGEYEAGFYYGLTEEDMIKIPAQWESSVTFVAHISSLEYDAEYMYKAYVNNGYNEICSATESFKTQASQSKPETGGDDSMILPFNTVTVGTMYSEVVVEVGGEADFMVSIPPSGVNWIECSTDGRKCTFAVSDNCDPTERSCDVRFFNLVNDEYEILTIYQPAVSLTESNLPFNYIEIPSAATHFSMLLLEELFSGIRFLYDGYGGSGWLKWGWRTDWKYLDFDFEAEENLSMEERMCRVIITYDGFDSVLTVVQKGRDEFFDLEDPVVGEICLEAFDIDEDGRLSYDELSQIPSDGLDVLDFSGTDVRSFDEFRFFHNITEINEPIIEDTGLESIQFPENFHSLDQGVFRNCTGLRIEDKASMMEMYIGQEVFKGCTGIQSVVAYVVGERAFENCTSLVEVLQRASGVLPYTFRNCESLSRFEFSICDEGCHLVGEEAFLGCVSLPEFTITKDIIEIQSKAFYGCSSLSAVYMHPDNPPALGEDVFTGTSTDLKIYVPSQSVDLYKSSWPFLADRIIEGDF